MHWSPGRWETPQSFFCLPPHPAAPHIRQVPRGDWQADRSPKQHKPPVTRALSRADLSSALDAPVKRCWTITTRLLTGTDRTLLGAICRQEPATRCQNFRNCDMPNVGGLRYSFQVSAPCSRYPLLANTELKRNPRRCARSDVSRARGQPPCRGDRQTVLRRALPASRPPKMFAWRVGEPQHSAHFPTCLPKCKTSPRTTSSAEVPPMHSSRC